MDPDLGITELEAARELIRLQSEEISKLMEQRRVMLDALRALIKEHVAFARRLKSDVASAGATPIARAALKFGGEG